MYIDALWKRQKSEDDLSPNRNFVATFGNDENLFLLFFFVICIAL